MANFRYRDTRTGRFATKKTWKKSKAGGGKRYKREKIFALKEWFVSFSYKGKKGLRVLDFYVVAATRARVIPLVYEAIDDGEDSNGFNLRWARKIAWEESNVDEIASHDSRVESKIRERVEVH